MGADGRNLGAGAKAEQPPVTKTDHKTEMDTDSVSTEKEKPTQQLNTEQIPDQWKTNERGQNDWRNRMGYNWLGPRGWGKSGPTLQPKGNYAKGGRQSPMWSNLKVDPGGKAFEDSEWSSKLNGRSVMQTMPLLSEFARYCDWDTEARRWAMMLYNHPVSLGIDYFTNNLNGNKTPRLYEESAGFLKRKLKSKIDENEEAIKKGDVYEPTNYDWMFKILRAKYQEPG